VARAAVKAVAARRGRGRPARLSREAIVEAGLALLGRAPDEPLTLSRVAEEVGAVPAALYRHVGSHDELIDGVLALALEGIRFEIRRRAGWRTQVRDWMTGLRAHLLRYPAVVSLIGRRGRTSPAWFDASTVLLEILERAGLRGAALARAYLWMAESTMGAIVTEATVPFSEQIEAARNALPEMSEDARRRHAALLAHVSSLDADGFFELFVDRTIAALADLIEKKA
jgi:TetR/AcrR family transcriptional regulator, tetracycline repressor protein